MRWLEMYYILAGATSTARSTPKVAEGWSELGMLNAVAAQLNELADTVREDLLAKGSENMLTIAETIKEIAHNYVVVEAANAEEAAKLERMFG